MKLKSKELIKVLLSEKKVKLKDLALKLSEITDKKYSADGLSHKIGRRTVTYDEVLQIAEILGYDIEFKDNGNEMV